MIGQITEQNYNLRKSFAPERINTSQKQKEDLVTVVFEMSNTLQGLIKIKSQLKSTTTKYSMMR